MDDWKSLFTYSTDIVKWFTANKNNGDDIFKEKIWELIRFGLWGSNLSKAFAQKPAMKKELH
jgi:hypothetical protein